MNFRNNSTGLNDSPDEKRSEIRIACTICNMNRDISKIAPMMNGMKANKFIMTSHYVLFFALASTQKRQRAYPQINNDNIVPPVSTVIRKQIEIRLKTASRLHLLFCV